MALLELGFYRWDDSVHLELVTRSVHLYQGQSVHRRPRRGPG